MPIAAMLAGAVHEPLDLPLSEVASFNCQIYDGWRTFLGCRFHADKPYLRGTNCLSYIPFLHSVEVAAHGVHRDRSGGSARLEGESQAWAKAPGGEGGRNSKIDSGLIPGNLV